MYNLAVESAETGKKTSQQKKSKLRLSVSPRPNFTPSPLETQITLDDSSQ